MGDSRDAGTPRMSSQWAMVMARFDDMARGLSRLEQRLDQTDRETHSEMRELRDQIQRTREEVAQASLTQERARTEGAAEIGEKIEAIGDRVERLEETRKADVREVLVDAAPTAVAHAVKRAPRETWDGLSIQAKVGTVSAMVALAGTLIAGVIDGAPKAAAFIVRVVTAFHDAGTRDSE